MALTGIFLMIFLLFHLTINLFLFRGEESFNEAVIFMRTHFIIRLFEYVLALGFLIHIIMGIKLHIQNKKKNNTIDYAVNASHITTSFSSRTMIYTGISILCFLILHLINFMIPMKYLSGRSDYHLVTSLFKNPYYTIVYVFSFFMLGIHLHHGFQSGFQSLGLSNKKRFLWIQRLCLIYLFIICSGFSMIAIWFFFN